MRALSATLAVLSIAGLAACGNADAESVDEPADAPWGRTFVSTDVSGTVIPGGGPLEVSFPVQGRISMDAGCNRGFGNVDLSGGTLVTDSIATTMMACEDGAAEADEWMEALFAASPSWALSGDTLRLTSPHVTVIFTDRQVTDPDRPLVGTTWVVESLIDSDTASTSTALQDAAPTLTIGPDSQATGSTGCNQFHGPAQVGDGTVSFGRLDTTDSVCPPDVAKVEQAVLGVLDGDVTYSVEGATMRLMRPDGRGLELRAR